MNRQSESSLPHNPEKQKRATRIDPDWYPRSPAIDRWAKEEGFAEWQWKGEVQQFIDHHTAKGNKMVDWQRAFYTWMRNSRKFQKGGAPQPTAQYQSLDEMHKAVGYQEPPRELRLGED